MFEIISAVKVFLLSKQSQF